MGVSIRPTPSYAPQKSEEKQPGFLEKFPALVALKKSTLESVHALIPKNPFTAVGQWMKARFHELLPSFLGGQTPPAAPQAPTPVVQTPPQVESPKEQPVAPASPDAGKAFDEADKKRVIDFEEKALDSFAKISNAVSPNKINKINKILRDTPDPNHSDPKNLNTIALNRLNQIKEMPKFGHPDTTFLTTNGYAENISRVYINEGKDIAKDFMDSEVHRRNMLGSHTRLGVAMDIAYDREKQKYFYYVVAIYAGGESIPKDQKMDPINIPEINNGEYGVDVLLPYFDALDQQTGGKIKYQLDPEKTILLEKELEKEGETKGALVITLSDESGKSVTYALRKNPPIFSRKEDGKKIFVLFKDVANDFAKAPDSRQTTTTKIEQAEAEPVPEEEFAGHA